MNKLCRLLFFALLVRPIMLVFLGLNVRRREGLPAKGPAVLVANHNSHLDAVTLMSLFPLGILHKLRPVAAQDYFFRNPLLKWFALNIMGILPLDRNVKSKRRHPLAGIDESLDQNDIVIVFPEGSRGAPEQLGEMKAGIAHIAKKNPEVPIIPIYMHGLGKALPKGEALLVPFFLDVFIGETLTWSGDKTAFMEQLTQQIKELAEEGNFSPWE
jgi:1-acyl-sn-glycerol-3-phosphate acyltransferase